MATNLDHITITIDTEFIRKMIGNKPAMVERGAKVLALSGLFDTISIDDTLRSVVADILEAALCGGVN